MKHVINGFITYEKSQWSDTAKIDFQSWKPSPDIFPDMVVVRAHSLEVDVPEDFDPRPEMIANLREQEQKAMADFELKVNQIRKQISELQALEFSSAAA